MSKRLKYIGGHDAVVLPDLIDPDTGEPVTVEQGALVPSYARDDLIAGLLEQPANWAEHKPKPAPAADSESAASDEKE